MSTLFLGRIKEQVCASHKRVEWNFKIPDTRALSPVFWIANQRYRLECIFENRYLLRLYRMGPPVDGPSRSVRWWAGLKRSDGTYHHRNAFGDLNLEEEFPIWKGVALLLHIESWESVQHRFNPVTVFFQMKVEQSSATAETCTHDSARDIFPPSDGITNEEQCNSHKHVEWIIKYTKKKGCWTSPAFESGTQLYRLTFSGTADKKTLRLFRLGPSEDGPGSCVRWCAGLKRAEGTYHHKNESGTLDLQNECELWSEVAELMTVFLRNGIEYYLDPEKQLSFIFWMNVEAAKADACNHGRRAMFPRGVGHIDKTEWTSYKLVQWTLEYRGEEDITSPVFTIDNQRYLFELTFDSCYRDLLLYRMGQSDDRTVRCLAGVSRSGIMHHNYEVGSKKLDLSKTCHLWTCVQFLHSFKVEEEIPSLAIDFLICLKLSSSVEEVRITAEGQVNDSAYLPEEDVLFKVKDKAFKIHRAIIRFAVPQMECVNPNIHRNGVSEVLVEDCDPTVFVEFLKLAESGFQEVPTVENASALCAVADTYRLENLKEMCMMCIEDTVSGDSS